MLKKNSLLKRIHCGKEVIKDTISYVWDKCEFETDKKSKLDDHKDEEHPKIVEYICHDCNDKFAEKEDRNKHFESKHPKSRVFPCKECNYMGFN